MDINIGRVIRSGEFDERADTEILPQNNCNNKSSIQFSVNRERTLEQSVNLTRKTEVGGELELAGKPLGVGAVGKIVAAIGAEYDHSSGVKIVDSGGMEFTIEAGDFPVYTVVWREKWEKGYVTIQHNDEELEVPYLYLSTARPELINVEYKICLTGEPSQEQPAVEINGSVTDTPVTPGSSDRRTSCLSSPFQALGNRWSGKVSEATAQGASRTYSHCPPELSIRYTQLGVDDDLEKVSVVCPSGDTEVTASFYRLDTPNETLPVYQSSVLTVPDGCRIDFTVIDTLGVSIGMSFSSDRGE